MVEMAAMELTLVEPLAAVAAAVAVVLVASLLSSL